MKDQYQKRISEYTKKAQALELQAEQEMRTGSGARAMELCKMADMEKINATNFKIKIETMGEAV